MIGFQNNVPLSEKTTFRIGGSALRYLAPRTMDELAGAVVRARRESLPVLVLGCGSNILVSDRGWPGLVIDSSSFTSIAWNGCAVTAQGGVRLDALAGDAVRQGYAGMEELSGIPGSVGGAVVMNAGAFSSCIADTLQEASYFDMSECRIVIAAKDVLGLGYRTSALQAKKTIVLSATFLLRPGSSGKLQEVRRTVLEKRRVGQPLDLPNCGSVFKRPTGHYAGALIEQAGLKGFRYGNAEISAKHANFIVNRGNATAAEVRHLIVMAQKAVYERSGVLLEPEVIFAGEFDENLFIPE
jgi:UDP-N-acetylmuramate dehydrogenase